MSTTPHACAVLHRLFPSAAVTTAAALIALFTPSRADAIVRGVEPPPESRRYDSIGALGFAARLGLDGPVPTPSDTWHCTVTLIAPDRALTARHCLVDGATGAPVDVSTMAVLFRRNPDGTLGHTDMTLPDTGLSSFHRVRLRRAMLSTLADVAVVELATPVTHITPQPLALWGSSLQSGTRVTIAGWGREGDTRADPQTGLHLCETTTTDDTTGSFGISPGSGVEHGQCGASFHDSGGPILFESASGELRVMATVTNASGGPHLRDAAGEPTLGLQHTPWAQADLSVDSVRYDETRFHEISERIVATVTLRNAGATAAPGAALELFVRQATPSADDAEHLLYRGSLVDEVPANSTRAVDVTVLPDASTAQSAHWLGARVTSPLPDALPGNDRYLHPQKSFYVTPRAVQYAGVWAAVMRHGEAGGAAGAIGLYERRNGSAVAIGWFDDGRAWVERLDAIPSDRVVTLHAPDRVSMALPSYYVNTRPDTTRVTVWGSDLTGAVGRDDPMAITGISSGFAQPAQGFYEGAFSDEGHEPIYAIVYPGGYGAFLVAPSLRSARGARVGANRGQWAAATPPSAPVTIDAHFDEALRNYVVSGQWTQSFGRTRAFRLVREGTATALGSHCHDDAECALGSTSDARCAAEFGDRCVLRPCTPGSCPAGSVCAPLRQGSTCVPACDSGSCDADLQCVREGSFAACLPRCQRDDTCLSDQRCDQSRGVCESHHDAEDAGVPNADVDAAPDGGTTTAPGGAACTAAPHGRSGVGAWVLCAWIVLRGARSRRRERAVVGSS